MSLTAGDSALRGTTNSVITATISQPPGVAAKIVAVPKNSTVDVAPNVPATLPATGDWSITLSVGDQLCPNKTQPVTVRCAAGFVEADGLCFCPAGFEKFGGACIRATTRCDGNKQWRDPTSGICRQKAEVALRASSEKLQVTLFKTRSTKSVTVQLEVRLQSGDVDELVWMATPGSSWISLGSSNGSVYSSKPAAIDVTADGTGLGDTATTGPISSNVTVRSTKAGQQSEDAVFVDGNDERTITVQLSINAVPYVSDSHVAIASSAFGRIVQPGEPVEAGDRLTVAVKAFDADGLPIMRRDLQLIVEVRGTLNGVYSKPLELNSTTSSTNVYTATIPENWIKEPETVESDVLPSSAASLRSPAFVHPLCCPLELDRFGAL
jgi:hypothetical protein